MRQHEQTVGRAIFSHLPENPRLGISFYQTTLKRVKNGFSPAKWPELMLEWSANVAAGPTFKQSFRSFRKANVGSYGDKRSTISCVATGEVS